MESDELVAREIMLNRFRRLLTEIQRGAITRSNFQPWEVEFLIDMESCHLEPSRKARVLKQYRKAVERQLEYGPGPPIKLSEFLKRRQEERNVGSL
jgi:hypothetical protein